MAELELYILVCKVCVVGVFMRNVSLSDPFKYFSRTLDLVFRTREDRDELPPSRSCTSDYFMPSFAHVWVVVL